MWPRVGVRGAGVAGPQLGREEEQRELQEACARILASEPQHRQSQSQQQRELCLITGVSGSGKTALAASLRPLVEARGGVWAAGKFDQLEGPGHFSAILQAITSWVDQMINNHSSGSSTTRQEVRDELRTLVARGDLWLTC